MSEKIIRDTIVSNLDEAKIVVRDALRNLDRNIAIAERHNNALKGNSGLEHMLVPQTKIDEFKKLKDEIWNCLYR